MILTLTAFSFEVGVPKSPFGDLWLVQGALCNWTQTPIYVNNNVTIPLQK